MKIGIMERACILFGLLIILMSAGCNDSRTPLDQTSANVNTKSDPAIKELEDKVGMLFPTNAVLIASTDGGGRDPSFGFFAWAVFSPSQLKMPLMHAPGVEDYLKLSLEDSVNKVQAMMRKKISHPQVAFRSEWQTNGFEFRGTLVRSITGDYLEIEQFRKK